MIDYIRQILFLDINASSYPYTILHISQIFEINYATEIFIRKFLSSNVNEPCRSNADISRYSYKLATLGY